MSRVIGRGAFDVAQPDVLLWVYDTLQPSLLLTGGPRLCHGGRNSPSASQQSPALLGIQSSSVGSCDRLAATNAAALPHLPRLQHSHFSPDMLYRKGIVPNLRNKFSETWSLWRIGRVPETVASASSLWGFQGSAPWAIIC